MTLEEMESLKPGDLIEVITTPVQHVMILADPTDPPPRVFGDTRGRYVELDSGPVVFVFIAFVCISGRLTPIPWVSVKAVSSEHGVVAFGVSVSRVKKVEAISHV